jgi:hypothetical protein
MKDNILRGKLLELLRKIYPEGVEQKTIISIFFQYHRMEAIVAALEYLVDKEYALRKEFPHPYMKQETIRWYKLCPKGIDLLDGNIPADPGILVPKG